MTLLRTRTVAALGGLACALTLGAFPAQAAGPRAAATDPKARELFGEVVRAYQALPAYQDRGEMTLTVTLGGRSKTQTVPQRLTLVRPNKLVVETGASRLISDGTTLTTVVNPLKTYATAPAPRSVTFETVFTAGPVGSDVFGGPGSPMMLVLLHLLVGDDPPNALRDLGESLTLGPDRVCDGTACRVLKVGSEAGPSYLLLVDPGTKLLRAIDVVPDPKSLEGSFPPGQSARIDTYRWSAGAVSTKPPADAAFAFETPKGFAKVGAPAAAVADDEPKFKAQGLVGKPAPDFTLTVLDGAGKTKTVSKADLAGKVVVIDFWATWCGPCLAELPEIQKLVESCARSKKDVVVAAVSEDDDPKDLTELRKLVESTLETKKIVLTGNPVGKVAIDPSHAVGDAFQVEGYPTVVILDAKGVVRSAHVGFSPDVGKVLGREVNALLDGEPLGQEKDGK